MKKLTLMVTVILFSMFGCSATRWASNAYKVNITDVQEHCETTELYELRPFMKVSLLAARYNSCLQIDNLFFVLWHGPEDEYYDTLSNLMMLEYLRLHNLNSGPADQLGHIYLRTEQGDDGVHTRFWQFKKVSTESESQKKNAQE